MISVGGSNSPVKAATPPAMPRSRKLKTLDRLTMLGSWQEMAKREGLVELVRGHPAVLVDNGVPGKYQNPAETGQRHPGKGQGQRKQVGRPRVGDGNLGHLGGRC